VSEGISVSKLDASYYQHGDKAYVSFGRKWVPARVVGHAKVRNWSSDFSIPPGVTNIESWQSRETYSTHIKVAMTLPHAIDLYDDRITPAGTPIFWVFPPDEVKLHSHDPAWNPHTYEPFMSPEQYQYISGLPRTNTFKPPLRHVGAYMNTASYQPGDPVWVWEESWRPATVKNTGERWVSVQYINGYRNRKGDRAKSYRSRWIWPALCDFPKVVKKLVLTL
jgi:hypothetical protein